MSRAPAEAEVANRRPSKQNGRHARPGRKHHAERQHERAGEEPEGGRGRDLERTRPAQRIVGKRFGREDHQPCRPDTEQLRDPQHHAPEPHVVIAAREQDHRRCDEEPAADPVDDERASAVEVQNHQHGGGDERPVGGEHAGADRHR
jgi:hypothetical protein